MKKTILIATAAAMALSGFAATAQPRPYGDRDRDGVPNYADRHDNRGGHRWAKGQRYDHYRDRSYQVSDWRARHWRAPPRGYAYYRTDTGDVVLAAIASGVIASVIANGYR